MPALNFQQRFAEAVEKGWKRQTVRPQRKRPFKRDDLLFLYTGMRTKKCRKLRTAACRRIFPVEISMKGVCNFQGPTWIDAEVFARADGFGSSTEMLYWFSKVYGNGDITRFVFQGVCIQW